MAKILTVDDESFILMILEAVLTSEGHEVITIEDSEKAAELLKSDEHLDLMISDVRMDPVNGVELLNISKRVRPAMPVVMVTAFHSDKAVADIMRQGATAYVRKPFGSEDIIATVKNALKH